LFKADSALKSLGESIRAAGDKAAPQKEVRVAFPFVEAFIDLKGDGPLPGYVEMDSRSYAEGVSTILLQQAFEQECYAGICSINRGEKLFRSWTDASSYTTAAPTPIPTPTWHQGLVNIPADVFWANPRMMMLANSPKNCQQTSDPDIDPHLPEAVTGVRAGLRAQPVRVAPLAWWPEATTGSGAAPNYETSVAGVSTDKRLLGSVLGSSVYVGGGWFATALHVLEIREGVLRPELCVFSARRKAHSLVPEQVFDVDKSSIRKDSQKDVAVFRAIPANDGTTAAKVFKTPKTADVAQADTLTLLAICGFPRMNNLPILIENNRLVKVIANWDSEANRLVADVLAVGATYGGNSGSGLFSQGSGELLAIVRAQADGTADVNADGTDVSLAPTINNAFRSVSIKHALSLIPR
jgi:hypothetical protein